MQGGREGRREGGREGGKEEVKRLPRSLRRGGIVFGDVKIDEVLLVVDPGSVRQGFPPDTGPNAAAPEDGIGVLVLFLEMALAMVVVALLVREDLELLR